MLKGYGETDVENEGRVQAHLFVPGFVNTNLAYNYVPPPRLELRSSHQQLIDQRLGPRRDSSRSSRARPSTQRPTCRGQRRSPPSASRRRSLGQASKMAVQRL